MYLFSWTKKQIEAAQISNKHARELREVESLLAEQLELVYTLQRENSASKKTIFERDATISKLKVIIELEIEIFID